MTPAAPVPADSEAEPPSDDWRQQLLVDTNAKGETRIRNCEANLHTVLLHAPEWRGVLRFNELTREIEHAGGPLRPDLQTESLDIAISVWLQQSDYGRLGLMARPAQVREVLREVAMTNAYDPLRDYLAALTWDGVPRADSFLERYFGAEGDTEHLRTISAKWLIGAVARGLQPGCKVDTVLILEGPQGIRKSTAFRVLAGEWFCDAPINIRDKDSVALAGQKWLIEMAELTAFRAADAEELKATISRNEDTYRPPYGRVSVKIPRRCVLVGTTNADEYLRNDASGYRRWWPVRCTSIDIDALMRDRDQLWAEAVARFKLREPWWLSEAEAKRAEAQATNRSESSGGPEESILQWLLTLPVEKRSELTTDAVALDALKFLSPGQVTRATRIDIGRAMRRLGFQRVQRRVAGVQTWVYLPPESIRTAPLAPPGGRPIHSTSLAVPHKVVQP